MSFLVAFSDTPAGRDALALGIRLAQAANAPLDIVVVRHVENATPPQDGFTRYLEATIDTWLERAERKAREVLPADHVRVHQRLAESTAAGLFDAAAELGAEMILVGGARDGLRGRLALSSLASVLVHASPVPVAMAPRRLRKLELEGVPRISVAIAPSAPEASGAGSSGAKSSGAEPSGAEPSTPDTGGVDPVARYAVSLAKGMGAQVRLISLALPDRPTPVEGSVPDTIDGLAVERETARGDTVAEALAHVSWEPSELLVLGSSRLAVEGRLFLGATAGKIVREVPVPVVVVPRADPRTRDVEQGGMP